MSLRIEPGAQQEFVRNDLRVGGRFFESRNKSLGPAHGIETSYVSGSPVSESQLWPVERQLSGWMKIT